MTFFQRTVRITFLLAVFAAPFLAYAVIPPATPTGPTTPQQVVNVVKNIAPFLFGLLLILAGIFLVAAAYTYFTAGDDAEQAKKAGHMILYTVAAIAAAAFARAVPFLVEQVTGLNATTAGNAINVGSAATNIINWLFGLLLIIAAAFFLYAGFLVLTGGGSEEKIASAKKFVFYAVAAIVVAAFARAIVFLVEKLLGVI